MRRSQCALLVLGILFAAAALGGERGGRHLLVVTGLGGESAYDELFHRWATTLLDTAENRFDIDPSDSTYLSGDAARTDGAIDGVSSRANIEKALSEIAGRSAPGDLVLVVLIGHGTARGDRVALNIPGPDMPAGELATLLDGLDGRRVAVVNTASSSGPFIRALSREGRVVITATASGQENLHPAFGGFFVTAFSDPSDRDKDGEISLLEAFSYSTDQVARRFDAEQRIRTEHALLDDNGDGEGSREAGGESADGHLAARWSLSPPDDPRGAGSPNAALLDEGRQLLDRIESLKRRKRQVSAPEYESRLEELLVQLALNRRALRSER